jgi:hypothetical protein
MSNAANITPGLAARTVGWTARTNVSLRLNPSLDVQSLVFYRGPMTVEQGHNASRLRVAVAARQKLIGDQLSVALRVTDPFNTSGERFTTTDPRFYQVSDQRRLDRGILLSVNWSFGKPPKEQDGNRGDLTGGDPGPP